MMNVKRATTWLLCLPAAATMLVVPACAGRRSNDAVVPTAAPHGSPAWVNRGSGAFNDGSRVFYGVGVVSGIRNVALARSSAETRARAEVGTALNTFISSLMRDYQSSISDIQRSEEQQMVEQTIRQFTDVNLSGVRITDHWQDPSNGTLYALARWDIEQASQSLEQMNQLNTRVRDYIRANAERAFDRLDAARNETRPPQP